jgi:phosphoribosylformylglycinamidine synthase
MVVKHHGRVVADIPAKKLADEAPLYHREAQEPEYLKAVRAFTLAGLSEPTDLAGCLPTFVGLGRASLRKTGFIANTITWCAMVRWFVPGSDAAVIRIKEDSLPISASSADSHPPVPEKYVAMTVDCNGVYVYLDPYEGGKAAITEACRNLACSGAVPLGATDNLNMANPHRPELFWQMKESVRGLADGCRAFNAPVTGGNCSLYNQSPAGPIDPTPTVAVVGLIEKPEYITTQWFKQEGDVVVLLGEACRLAGSPARTRWQRLPAGGSRQKTGVPPRCDLEQAAVLHTTLLGLIQSGLIQSAHDCSDGGLAVALAESCISHQTGRGTPQLIGAQIDLSAFGHANTAAAAPAAPAAAAQDSTPQDSTASAARAVPRLDALLFGETQNRVVVSVRPLDAVKVIERAKLLGVPAMRLGVVGGDALSVKTPNGEYRWATTQLHDAWWNSLGRLMA